MSEFGNVGSDPELAAFDPLALAEAMRGRLGVGEEVAGRLRGLRGTAESADGAIRVEVDEHGRLAGITLDPRSMRLPSVELAEEIVAVSKRANLDLTARATELVGDPRNLVASLDPTAIKQRLTEMGDDFSRVASMSRDQFDELQRRLRTSG